MNRYANGDVNHFFHQTFFSNRVLARCMSWFISFALAYLSCKEREARITKCNILPLDGLEITIQGSNSRPLDCEATTVTTRPLYFFQ